MIFKEWLFKKRSAMPSSGVHATRYTPGYPLWFGPVILLGSFIIVFATFLGLLQVNTTQTQKNEIAARAESLGDNLRLRLKGNQDYLLMIAKDRGEGAMDLASFQKRASLYVEDHPELICITWVDADFLIIDVAPLAPNQEIAGLRLNLPEPKRASRLARERRKPVYTRPFEFVQGDLAFEIWVPVYRNDDFLGLIGGTYSCNKILQQLIPAQILKATNVGITDASGNVLFTLPQTEAMDENTSHQVSLTPPESGVSLHFTRYGSGHWGWRILLLEYLCMALVLAMAYAMWGLNREIAMRRQAEQALQLKNLVFDASIAAKSITNMNGIITELNDMFLRIFGYSDKTKVIGKPIQHLFNDPNDFRVFVAALQDKGQWEGEFTAKREEGSTFAAHTIATSLRDEKGKLIGYQSSIMDVTERLRVHAELQKMQKLTSVGTLAGGIAHDFNNILMALFGNLSLAKKELPKDHPAFKHLEEAAKSMKRAIRLTKQLLTFAKGGEPVLENVSLGALVEEVARFDLSGSNVMLVYKSANDLWMAKADNGQIQQVISNLTTNAREAMPDGGHLYITVENEDIKKAVSSTLPAGRYIRISVRDEGAGIDPKYLGRIFDPYFTTKQTGSGLGLATTYSIITKHGGQIGVISELGKGSHFTIYLPASETDQPKTVASPVEPQPFKPAPKILILDDEKFILMVIPHWLKQMGCFVETASDGQQAIDLYKQSLNAGTPFDVLILDLTIPGGIGGLEVIKTILAIDPNAKAIASSGYSEGAILSNYAFYGFKGVLAKPYTEAQLHEVLGLVLK